MEYSCERELDLAERELFKRKATIAAQAARIEALTKALEACLDSHTEDLAGVGFRCECYGCQEAREALLGAVPVVGAGTRAEVDG